ncbi:LysR family transcriptional regulator [Holophaga foetida]|uniref:LysR family transcriptional regulator n=1 Tax=Holophaga foetida TaxID=35839 RepID=UPI0002472F08|nr:LysR substrate-binding domain-containing protein [Holophaga foetida]
MELRHLRYFVAVAETENYTQAARQLRIAQPALSQRMKDLEAELGLTLFVPKGRGIRLTPAGRYYLAEVRQMLERLATASDAARQIQRGEVGSLRLATLETLSLVEPLPKLLQELRTRHPGLHLKLVGMHYQAQNEALRNGSIDVGIVDHHPTQDMEVSALPILDIPILAMLPAQHPLADRPSLKLEDLEGLDFIWPEAEASTSYWTIFRKAFEGRTWRPRVVQEASSFATTASLVSAGFGCALGIAVPPNTILKGIVQIPIEDIDLRLKVHLVWRPDNPSPVLQRFLEVAMEVIRDHP